MVCTEQAGSKNSHNNKEDYGNKKLDQMSLRDLRWMKVKCCRHTMVKMSISWVQCSEDNLFTVKGTKRKYLFQQGVYRFIFVQILKKEEEKWHNEEKRSLNIYQDAVLNDFTCYSSCSVNSSFGKAKWCKLEMWKFSEMIFCLIGSDQSAQVTKNDKPQFNTSLICTTLKRFLFYDSTHFSHQ